MGTFTISLIAGLSFAVIDSLIMIPIKFESKESKRKAVISTFIQRFATGFVIPYVTLPVHHAIVGTLVAIFLSFPLVIYMKRYSPLMGGVIGFIIGWLT